MRRILDGAHRVLIEHGYAGFTTRRVAQAAAMRPGNLAYHFPSKRALLRALIARLVADYSQRLQALLLEPDTPLGCQLKSLVQWLFLDAVTENTVRTFRELWAMALDDAVIRRAVDDLYDEIMEAVVQLVHRARPTANLTSIREMIHVLALMSEGVTVLYGTKRERPVPFGRAVELATKVIEVLAPDLQLHLAPSDVRSGRLSSRS